MSFVTFMCLYSAVATVFGGILLTALSRVCASNLRLEKKLRASKDRELAQRRIIERIEELQARVPSVEPAWGSDPSGEPSRESVAIAEERKILTALREERDSIEASLKTPRHFFDLPEATWGSEKEIPKIWTHKEARTEQVGVPGRTFADAERRAVSYLDGRFGRKWLQHTLRCIDVRDDEISVLGSPLTYTASRIYVFSVSVVT